MKNASWFAPRPPEAIHHHPFLVFDTHGQLHFELTVFAKEAAARVERKTAEGYLRALLPFFTYLETANWQKRAERSWDEPPEQVRKAVTDYLVQHLGCLVRPHPLDFQVVSLTAQTHRAVRLFLTSLKLFYQIMQLRGSYPFPNPLVDANTTTSPDLERQEEEYPRMPAASGVAQPASHRSPRLTTSYFKLEDGVWTPQIVDDPTLFARVLAGGRSLTGWKLREECVTRILFESGARLSEVVGLTLGDWIARGMTQEALAFSKGSHGRRVKFLKFSADTAKLLRRYFDEERCQFDPYGYTLETYLTLIKNKQIDPQTVPLFLTAQRHTLSPKGYREQAWNPACRAAGIDADVHQARHWHVTLAVRFIYETATTEGEVQRRLRELVEYMKWRSKETLEAYEHYLNAARHAETLDQLHQRMHEAMLHYQSHPQEHFQWGHASAAPAVLPPGADEPDLAFLYQLGGDS
jgi:hypothetical protein